MNRFHTFLSLTFVLIAVFVGLTPTTQALNTDWTSEYASSVEDSVREITLAHDGERLGMAYRYATTNGIGFSVRSAAGAWSQPNALVVAAATLGADVKLLNLGSGHWLLFYLANGAADLHATRSLDDGATWTDVDTGPGNTVSAYDAVAITPTKIGVAECFLSGARLSYIHSFDAGATWGAGIYLDDNAGGSGTPTANVGCGPGVTLSPTVSGNVYAVWSATGTSGCGTSVSACIYRVNSFGGNDGSWNVPFGVSSCLPQPCIPTELGTVPLPALKTTLGSSTYGVAFSRGNYDDSLVMVRNTNCATTPNTPTILTPATAPANPATDTASSTCNFYSGPGTFQPVSGTGCAAYGRPTSGTFGAHDRIVENSAHRFLTALGHTTVCSGVGFEIDLKPTLAAAWEQTYTDTSLTTVFDLDMTPTKSYAAFVDTNAAGLVKVVWALSPTSSGASLSRTFAGTPINGFAVDPDNNEILLRLQSTDQILQSLNPVNLANKGTTIHSPCTTRVDGVMAYHDRSLGGKDFLAFIDCPTGSPTQGSIWRVRSDTLGTPNQEGTACTDGFVEPECDIDITGSSFVNCPNLQDQNLPTRTGEIGNIAAIPISWQTSSTAHESATLGFAFTDRSTGQLGVWGIQQNPALVPDIQCKDTMSFSDPDTTNQFCSWIDSHDLNNYIAGVGPTANTRAARVDVVHATDTEFDMNLAPFPALGSPWNHAKAMSCSGNDGIVLNTLNHVNKIHLIGAGLGQPVWATDAVLVNAPTVRGVAFSQNELVSAYVDGPSINVLNGTTGAFMCSVTSPAGSVYALGLDSTGAGMWVAANSGIDGSLSFYDIHVCTNAAPVGTTHGGQCLDNAGNPTDCDILNPPPTTNTTSGATFGILHVSQNVSIIGGLVVFFGFGIVGYTLTRKRDG